MKKVNKQIYLLIGLICISIVLTAFTFGMVYHDELYKIELNHKKFSKFLFTSKQKERKELDLDMSVTRIIHQSWKSLDVLPVFEKYCKTWTQFCYPHWNYMFWTDEDNLNLIRNHYPWFLKKYNELPANIYRADVSRYFYLFHYGGIYTDMDNECLKPFEFLLRNYSLVFGAMVGQYQGTNLKEGYVQNSFMYSKPRMEFWLELIMDILNFNETSDPEGFTGPIKLSKKIDEYRKRKNGTEDLIIYPPNYFNPYSWIDDKDTDKSCKSYNKMTDTDYQKCRKSMLEKGSYVVQYHAHTWN